MMSFTAPFNVHGAGPVPPPPPPLPPGGGLMAGMPYGVPPPAAAAAAAAYGRAPQPQLQAGFTAAYAPAPPLPVPVASGGYGNSSSAAAGQQPSAAPKPPVPAAGQQQQQQSSRPHQHRPSAADAAKAGHHHHHSQHHRPSAAPGSSGSVLPMASENRLRRDTPFLAHIRFKNDLPEIPSDPKMLVSQIQPEALAQFALTTLERQAKRDLLSAPNILVSPLDAQRYQVPEQPGVLDPADLALLKEEARTHGPGSSAMPAGVTDRNKSFAARAVGMSMDKCSWLMRTTYISSADNRVLQKQGLPEKAALQQRAAERRAAGMAGVDDEDDDRELNDRDAQVVAIEASFAAAQRPPVHSRNPALKPVEVLPVLPDLEPILSRYLYTTFVDSDPFDEVLAAAGQDAAVIPPAQRPHRFAGHYLLKGFTHHVGGAAAAEAGGKRRELKIMALLLPEDIAGTVAQAQAAAAAAVEPQPAGAAAAGGGEQLQPIEPEALQGDYQWAKEYNYELDRESVHYALRLGPGAATYYKLGGKLELRSWKDEEKLQRERGRKRGRAGGEEDGEEDEGAMFDFQRPSKFKVATRQLTGKEVQERQQRQEALEPAS